MATGLPLFFGDALLGVQPIAVVLLHDAVEGVSSAAFAADGEVEAEGGECAFLVVADDGVGAVFVLFVEFIPSGEAGFGKALFQTAFGL